MSYGPECLRTGAPRFRGTTSTIQVDATPPRRSPCWSTRYATRVSELPPAGSDRAALLQGRETAVDDQHLAGDVARLAGEQEHRSVCDLPRGALASQRHRRAITRRPAERGEPAERRVDQARDDHVGADAAARALQGDVPAQSEDPRLGRV